LNNNTIKYLLFTFLLIATNSSIANTTVKITGELKKWHTVTLTFNGPKTSENDDNNPFLNYRFNVEFTHTNSNKRYVVPGFFAADGDAANSSADSGDQWRVHFRPDQQGEWKWRASFRKSPFIALSSRPIAGFSGEFMDKQTGKFLINKSDKTWPDFRARGRLEYVDKPYLQFSETGKYFIKAGPDSPENLLSYADFDGNFSNDGHKDEFVKTWSPHERDWKRGNPSWQNGKGKGLIGALNYLASKGLNSVSFLTMNILGDDQNVFPYINYDTFDRLDVSKLDQWNIVFEHAQNLGLFLHFKTQEAENQGLLDNGGVGMERQLYYRELIARFGHHLALNWNIGEENGDWYPKNTTPPQSTHQRIAMARYFYDNDPYRHHVVMHNGVDFSDLLGDDSYYTGVSLQTHRTDFGAVHNMVKKLRSWPTSNGRPLAVSADEPGDAEHSLTPDSVNPEHNFARANGLWGALTAGAWGTEWYFGYKHPHSDLTAQDWRSRDKFWDQARHALTFFDKADIDFQEGNSHDELSDTDWVFSKLGSFYVVYTQDASFTKTLKVFPEIGRYSIEWFDPRNGGNLQTGSVKSFSIDTQFEYYWERETIDLGTSPNSPKQDWVILIKRLD
jgi:hypothetical protein